MATRTLQFKIYRYDPDKDAKPYMQTVEVELDGSERMLLDALIGALQRAVSILITQGGITLLISLALLCGHVGKWGSGLNPLRGQNNVQGGGDMGAGLLLKSQLGKLGINLTVEEKDSDTLSSMFYSDTTEGRPDMFRYGWWPDYNDPTNEAWVTIHSAAAGSNGGNGGWI